MMSALKWILISGLVLASMARANTDLVPVEVMDVHFAKQAKTIVASGVVRPVSEQGLSFRVSGFVDKVLVREGQTVVKGQVLAQLRLDEIDAQVAKAEVMLADNKRQLKRIEQLVKQQLASDEQAKQAKTAVDVAASELKIARFNREYAVIRSPSDGRILTRHLEPNEQLASGQVAFRFADESMGWNVRLAVADIDVVRLNLGDSASIELDAYPGQVFTGKVREIAASSHALSQTFEVDVEFTQVPRLYSGLVAHTRIQPSQTQTLSAIPLTALLTANANQGLVYVLDEQGKPVKRRVQLAYLDKGNALVEAGLKEDEQVIVQGGPFVIEGQKVKVVTKQVSKDL